MRGVGAGGTKPHMAECPKACPAILPASCSVSPPRPPSILLQCSSGGIQVLFWDAAVGAVWLRCGILRDPLGLLVDVDEDAKPNRQAGVTAWPFLL